MTTITARNVYSLYLGEADTEGWHGINKKEVLDRADQEVRHATGENVDTEPELSGYLLERGAEWAVVGTITIPRVYRGGWEGGHSKAAAYLTDDEIASLAEDAEWQTGRSDLIGHHE